MQIRCNISGAHHVQHVLCHVVRRDRSAIKFDRVFRIYLSFILLAGLLTDGRTGFLSVSDVAVHLPAAERNGAS